MGEPKQYAYEDLATDKHQIRVLHVHAATTWHEEISCHLTLVSLGDNPQFQALSYVWGDPKDTNLVQLDGHVFPVTRNLEAAIRRLRKSTEDRVIWIDQLCINQANLDEKSAQVAIMPQIYMACSEVILWLGEIDVIDEITVEDAAANEEHTGGIAAAGLALIEEHASEKHVHEMSCFQLINESTIIPSPNHAIAIEGLRLITNLPYWDRAWIVQENILPPKAIVILGSCTLPWSSFLLAATQWSKHVLECCRLLSDSLPLDTKNLILAFFTKLNKTSAVDLSRIRQGSQLFGLLRNTRARKASDDRDKVFSVLGLVTDWFGATPVVPDYSLTTAKLYADVTEHLISSMSNSLFVFVSNHRRRPGFPSWVHDWAAEDPSDYPFENTWADLMWFMYSASAKLAATVKRHGDSILLVDGYYVDRIVTVGDAMEVHDWKSAVPIFDSWTAMTDVDRESTKPYIAGGDLDNAFWRCMVGNVAYIGSSSFAQISPYVKVTQEHYPAYVAWKEGVRTAVDGQWMLSADTVAVYMTLAATARHRRMFVTEKGYIGMGGLATAVGDDVHVLLGSNVAFVNRTAVVQGSGSNSIDPSIKNYRLVGECYVHGIMDGEVLSDPSFQKETIALC